MFTNFWSGSVFLQLVASLPVVAPKETFHSSETKSYQGVMGVMRSEHNVYITVCLSNLVTHWMTHVLVIISYPNLGCSYWGWAALAFCFGSLRICCFFSPVVFPCLRMCKLIQRFMGFKDDFFSVSAQFLVWRAYHGKSPKVHWKSLAGSIRFFFAFAQ